MFCLLAASFFCPTNATVYTDNGSAATYTLNAGDSLSIASGTFTGTINGFPTGAIIAVQSGAVFQPSSMPFPNIHGTLYVYGTFKMTTQLRSNTGFVVKNYGVIWVTSTTLMSGSSQVWTNYFGGPHFVCNPNRNISTNGWLTTRRPNWWNNSYPKMVESSLLAVSRTPIAGER